MSTNVGTKEHLIPARDKKEQLQRKIENFKSCFIIFLFILLICSVYNNVKTENEKEALIASVDLFTDQVKQMPTLANRAELEAYIFRISLSSVNPDNKHITDAYSNIAMKLAGASEYMNETINTALMQYNDVKSKYDLMADNYKAVRKAVKASQKQSRKILKENKKLVKQLNSTEEELAKFQKRSELYNKYEYAIINGQGNRTELTYHHLQTIEDLANKYGISPYLMTSEIMVESGGRQYATNCESTARGFGQILSGTGRFVYQNLLHYGTYDHNYAFNGDTNLTMMAALLGYWKNKTGSTQTAIHRYRAADFSTNEAYINKMCRVSGMTRSQLGIY